MEKICKSLRYHLLKQLGGHEYTSQHTELTKFRWKICDFKVTEYKGRLTVESKIKLHPYSKFQVLEYLDYEEDFYERVERYEEDFYEGVERYRMTNYYLQAEKYLQKYAIDRDCDECSCGEGEVCFECFHPSVDGVLFRVIRGIVDKHVERIVTWFSYKLWDIHHNVKADFF